MKCTRTLISRMAPEVDRALGCSSYSISVTMVILNKLCKSIKCVQYILFYLKMGKSISYMHLRVICGVVWCFHTNGNTVFGTLRVTYI
jgi:hypothetical protein